jgi:hypothetical protein
MWASVFDRGERRPIAQLKGAPGLLEICASQLVQMETIAGGKNQVIERTELCEEGFHSPFVRRFNRLPLRFSTDAFNGFLNSFGTAGGDNDLGSLRGRLLGDCQTNPRRPTHHNHPLVLQTVSPLH